MMSFDQVRTAFDNINPFHVGHHHNGGGFCQREEELEVKLAHQRTPAFTERAPAFNNTDGSMHRRYSSYSSAATTAEHFSPSSSATSSPLGGGPESAMGERAAGRRVACVSCPSCDTRLDASSTMCEICGETILSSGWAPSKRPRTSSVLNVPPTPLARQHPPSPLYHPLPFNPHDAQPLVWTQSKFRIRNPTNGQSVEVELPLPAHMREEGSARQLQFTGDGMWM